MHNDGDGDPWGAKGSSLLRLSQGVVRSNGQRESLREQGELFSGMGKGTVDGRPRAGTTVAGEPTATNPPPLIETAHDFRQSRYVDPSTRHSRHRSCRRLNRTNEPST